MQGITPTLIDTNPPVEGAGSDCAMPRRGAGCRDLLRGHDLARSRVRQRDAQHFLLFATRIRRQLEQGYVNLNGQFLDQEQQREVLRRSSDRPEQQAKLFASQLQVAQQQRPLQIRSRLKSVSTSDAVAMRLTEV